MSAYRPNDCPTPEALQLRCWSTVELRASGLRKRDIADAVASGRLARPRRGWYVLADAPEPVVAAIALGGRLTCVSLLRLLGVFVLERGGPHVQLRRNASRLPQVDGSPGSSAVLHWAPPIEPRPAWYACSGVVDAVVRAVTCQPPRAAIATIDSALHRGLLDDAGLAAVFTALPLRYLPLRRLVDARAESGPETLMRLLLRGIAKRVEVQVTIAGVGRVDLLVDGWLIIECDSDAHHAGLDARRVDSARDLAAAALGYLNLATDGCRHHVAPRTGASRGPGRAGARTATGARALTTRGCRRCVCRHQAQRHSTVPEPRMYRR